MKTALCLLLISLLAAPALGDIIINFDDLASTGMPETPLPAGYAGFNWTGINYFGTASPSFTGIVSPPNAGLIRSPSSSFVETGGHSFTLVSINIASGFIFTPNLTLTVEGLDHGVVVDSTVINTTLMPSNFTFNFSNITEVAFVSESYTTLDDIDIVMGSTPDMGMESSFATTPGLTDNQRGIATSIDTAGNGAFNSSVTQLIDALSALPISNLPGALDELSPLKFACFASSTAFNNEAFVAQDMDAYLQSLRDGAGGGFVRGDGQLDSSGFVVNDPNVDPGLQMVHSRMLAWSDPLSTMADMPGAELGGIDLKQMKCCPACCEGSSPWDVFLRGNVVLAQGFSQADVPHFDDNTASVVAGADYHLSAHCLVGVTASYAHTDATLDTASSSATVDSYSPGLYASWADGGGYVNVIGRYSYNSYTQARNIAFLGQTASSATDGHEGMIDLDGGYDFHSGPWTFGPVAGFQYTHLTVNGYAESGSVADLAVNEDQSDSLRSRLGGNVRFDFHGCGVTFSPHLTAAWQHEFMDQGRGLTSAFTQFSGGSFTVRTPNSNDDSALVDIGLDAHVNNRITVFGDYVVQAGQDDYFGQSLQAGLRVSF